MRKILSRGLLILYLVTLTWLVLFKLTFNISRILHYHHRSLNLVPFAAPKMVNGRIDLGEIILNCVFFIPFGLLLSVNFKKVGFLPKLACIMVFSVCAELIQYIFAIGATDITDVISNTAGGFLGLVLYYVSNKYINTEKLDRIIVFVGTVLLVLAILIQFSHFFLRHHQQ
jgi:glycopeptide antibiotics resistance protein